MKKTDPDYIAKLEKAIADKYGKETIAHPKADWDDEKLSGILETLRNEGQDITGLGWSDDELNDLLDYVLCPSDVVETVRFFMDDYIDQEVNKRIDEIDEKIKDIYKK